MSGYGPQVTEASRGASDRRPRRRETSRGTSELNEGQELGIHTLKYNGQKGLVSELSYCPIVGLVRLLPSVHNDQGRAAALPGRSDSIRL